MATHTPCEKNVQPYTCNVSKSVVYVLLGTLVGIALLWQLPISSTLTEDIYSRTLFPALAFVLVRLTDLPPFSVAGVGLVVLPLFAIFALTRAIQKKLRIWALLRQTVLITLIFYNLFMLLWGANYRRLDIETLLNLEPKKISATDLENTAQHLLEVLNSTQNAPREYPTALASVRQAIQTKLETITGIAPTLPTQIKATPAGFLFAFGASGVVSPLTLEAHADSALPEPFFLAVAAHELVHTAGFSGEADTDVLAALSGLSATDAYARYSVALWYFARVFNDLPKTSQQRFRALLPNIAQADYAQLRLARERHSLPLVSEVAQFFYGGYLKSQGVQEGTADYSRIGRLLAAAHKIGLTNP
jgi:hypothetical protein